MALYNVATVKRIDTGYKTRMTRVDGIIFHIAVSNADFPHYLPGTKAHFYVRKDGTICQEIDTAFRSGANLEGNPFYLSVETEGGVGADINGPWTQAQVESLALLAREAARIEGFPVRQMNSSRAGEQGIGWHRLGIDGNFPAFPNILAGRIQRGGGLKYSKSRGKVCPTDSRIVQIPKIIELAGNNAPKPNPEEEDVMASKEEVADEIFNRAFTTPEGRETNLKQLIRWHDNGTVQIMEAVKAIVPVIVNGVLNTQIKRSGMDGYTSVAAALAWNDRNIEATRDVVRDTGTQVVNSVGDIQAITAQVTEQVLVDVEDALKNVNLRPS